MQQVVERPKELVERAEELENDLWKVHFEKRLSANGSGGERANPKAFQAICNYCKVRDAWPEGKDGWTCGGIKRDMVRHLSKCLFFDNSSARAGYTRMLRNHNLEKRIASGRSPAERKERGRQLTLEPGREEHTVVSERQQFEEATLKMMIDCDLPPTWLEEPTTAALMGHLRPDLTLPTAKHIATTVLDRVAKKAENTMRKKLKTAKGVSLLFDTWVNRTKEHMLGFVVATDDRQVPISLRLPSSFFLRVDCDSWGALPFRCLRSRCRT